MIHFQGNGNYKHIYNYKHKSEVKFFNMLKKVKLLMSKAANSCPKIMDFFQMLLASEQDWKHLKIYWIWKKIEDFQSKVESHNFHRKQIMQELPTNKPKFPFTHTLDFNPTTHVALCGPIVFIDNISLYFNAISSVQDLTEES